MRLCFRCRFTNMGMEGTSLWARIEQVAQEEGVELFDLDLPSDTARGGVLKVYITKGGAAQAGTSLVSGVDTFAAEDINESETKVTEEPVVRRTGISFEDCVRVSKRILDIDEQQEIIPANCTLEVSSPGINRKLRLLQHFSGALGERVKVKYRDLTTGATHVVSGHVRRVDGEAILLENEAKKEEVLVSYAEIRDARVDFKF